MSKESWVLRVPQVAPHQDAFVLVRVSRDGPASLDITLTGTEGVHPYVGSVTQTAVGDLQAKNYRAREHDWAQILSSVLLPHETGKRSNEEMKGVELVSSVTEGKEIILTVRKNITGITQRLGSISLLNDESQEIELFDWTGLAAEAASAAQVQSRDFAARIDAQAETVHDLTRRLDEVIKAKEEHEVSMLESFRALLNAKKASIREHKRALGHAKLPSDEGPKSHETASPRDGGLSSPRKRKAQPGLLDEDDDETMAHDEAMPDRDRDSDPGTTESSDQETAADEPSDLDEMPPVLSTRKGKILDQQGGRAAEVQETAPPRRSLPFPSARPGTANASVVRSRQVGGNTHVTPADESTEDDEP